MSIGKKIAAVRQSFTPFSAACCFVTPQYEVTYEYGTQL